MAKDEWMHKRHSPRLKRFYHALGVLHANWNVVELQFQQLLWFLIARGPEVGGAITFSLGNVEREHMMLTLARASKSDDAATRFFEYAQKLFERNRANRNFLSHCRIMYVSNMRSNEIAIVQQFTARGKIRATQYVILISQLRDVADDVKAMGDYFVSFFGTLDPILGLPKGDVKEWLKVVATLRRPPMPRSLPNVLRPIENPDDQRRQRRGLVHPQA